MVMVGSAGGAPTVQPPAWVAPMRPGVFCSCLLQALEAAEGQTRRRKRDQSPDKLGLAIKRELLQRAVAADPEPATFEAWLMEQILQAPSAGPVRAMCEQMFLEYQMAALQPDFTAWLTAGAPSDDAEPERSERRRERAAAPERHDHWHGSDDPTIACTCHLDHR